MQTTMMGDKSSQRRSFLRLATLMPLSVWFSGTFGRRQAEGSQWARFVRSIRRGLSEVPILTVLVALLLLTPTLAQDDLSKLEPPFTFALYGDCRDGHEVHRAIVAQMLKSDAMFVVQTGDLVRRGDNDPEWVIFREITQDLRAKVPYYASKGNHDKGNKENFEKEFGLKDTYYDKRLGSVHFFFLDSNRFDEEVQLAWLQKTAVASTATHKIAVFHHPPFTVVPRRVNSAAKVRDTVHGLLAKLGFCAALLGHDHLYHFARRDGVAYVVSGGGGAPLYEPDPKLAQPGDLWRMFHHYILLSVEKEGVRGRVFEPNGTEAKDLAFSVCGVHGSQSLETPKPKSAVVTPSRPKARLETDPVPNSKDAADDPAIWIHPFDPAKSLILGTDKRGALHSYNLDGTHHAAVGEGLRPNNVDVRYDVQLGGRRVDVAAASVRKNQNGVMVWTIDPESRQFKPAVEAPIPVFGGAEPYGFCLYRRAKDRALFFFVNDEHGRVEQYRLEDSGKGTFKATRVRQWEVGSQTEGCVADDEYGVLYIGEEEDAIWRYGAELDDPADEKSRVKVAGTSGPGAFVPDVEGLAIYYAADGKGYLIASSQGSNSFLVYRRERDNSFVKSFDPVASDTIDDVEDTDGTDVTNVATPAFPKGFFVAQDGSNDGGNQNFKVYAWEDIAGSELVVDTSWNPRKPVWRR